MARLERMRVYPVKGLDGISVETAEVLDGGTLAHDREFAIFDTAGDVVNGKRTDRVHGLTTDFEPESGEYAVEAPDGETYRFDLYDGHERAERWFSDYFDMELTLRRDTTLGYVDRREMGPSVISTATLRTVASWFDGMTVEGARRRLRANVEVSGVPPFWEDRFVGDGAPVFEIGGIQFEGVTPCGRCVVPERDPDTADPLPEFREQFVRKRQETFPEWGDRSAFDHYYTLMLISWIREADRKRMLSVGDPVNVVEL